MTYDRLFAKCVLAFMFTMLMVASLCMWLWGGEGGMENWQRGACVLVGLLGLVVTLWAE